MTTPEFYQLLDVVEKMPCSYSRRVMRRGLAALSGRSIYINRSAIVGPEELAFVASMLGKMSSAELRDVVMIRLQCSRAKAYKLIKRAIEAKGKGAQAAPPAQLGPRLEDDGVD